MAEPFTDEATIEALSNVLAVGLTRTDTGGWQAPWSGFSAFPVNAFTGRPFKGRNVMILWAEARAQGFKTHLWASKDAWFKRRGGCPRPSAKGALIMVPQFDETSKTRWTPTDAASLAQKIGPIGGDPLGGEQGAFEGFLWERWYNLEEIEGVVLAEPDPDPHFRPFDPIDRLYHGWRGHRTLGGPALYLGGVSAHWSPGTDRITMPPLEAWPSRTTPAGGFIPGETFFYATLLHEMTHASGSVKRLNRDTIRSMKGNNKQKEELVAEIGSVFLGAKLGLAVAEIQDHNIAYLQSWLSGFQESKKLSEFSAAVAEAQRAMDYILVQSGIACPTKIPAVKRASLSR